MSSHVGSSHNIYRDRSRNPSVNYWFQTNKSEKKTET
jgi:hypothetical protein